jgi:hypothetical protein
MIIFSALVKKEVSQYDDGSFALKEVIDTYIALVIFLPSIHEHILG